MKKSRVSSLALMLACCQSWSATIVYSYNKNGDVDGISAITGITQESSWRCKNSDAILCSCPSTLLEGVISQVDYRKGDSIAEGFAIESTDASIYINLGENWDSDLGTSDSSWIPKLLHRGEKIIVIAEICGVSGQNIVGRDVFKNKPQTTSPINPGSKKVAKPRLRAPA